MSAADQAKDDSLQTITYRRLFTHYVGSNTDSAELFAKLELKTAINAGLKRCEADAYEDLARISWQRSNLNDAIEKLQNAQRIYESLNDQRGVANCENNIGIIYWNLKSPDQALQHYRNAMVVRIATNDSSGVAACYGNIGLIYRETGKIDSADLYYRKCTAIREKLGNPATLAIAYNNMGSMFLYHKNADSAIVYFEKCRPLYNVTNDKFGYAGFLNNLGTAYRMKGDLAKARDLQLEGAKVCIEIDNKDVLKNCYGELASIYEDEGDYKTALRYFAMKDSVKSLIFQEDMSQQISEMSAKYQTERKQRENDQLKAEASEDAMWRNFLIVLVILGLLGVAAMFYAYTNKRKSNQQLALQNAQIEAQKNEITDSINYAQRIQRAILPPVESLRAHFPDSFVFYLPKAIVSGDFWWMLNKNNYLFFAVADCTGHGVPGAFMSMLGMEMLNDISRETDEPSEILSQLSKGVRRSLRQTSDGDSQSRDGMDICLVRINTVTQEVVFAGANRPLWIKRASGALEEMAPTKAPIGGPGADDQVYISHNTTLSSGDTLYLFTDGYADQFGGAKGKKLKTSGLRVLLEEQSLRPMLMQERELEGYFHRWRGVLEQVDDVLIAGIRMP